MELLELLETCFIYTNTKAIIFVGIFFNCIYGHLSYSQIKSISKVLFFKSLERNKAVMKTVTIAILPLFYLEIKLLSIKICHYSTRVQALYCDSENRNCTDRVSVKRD